MLLLKGSLVVQRAAPLIGREKKSVPELSGKTVYYVCVFLREMMFELFC